MTKTMHYLISELLSANQYEPGITLSMLQNISLTCSQKGSFEHFLNNKIVEVDRDLSVCNYMDKINANEHMTKKGLDPKSILNFLTLKYNQLLKDNLWTPAKNPIDSTKPPSLNVTVYVYLQITSITTCSKLFSTSFRLMRNHNKQLTIRKLPKILPVIFVVNLATGHPIVLRRKKELKQDLNKAGKGSTKVAGKGSQSWRRTRPEFFWCEKCKRWTPSHGTSTHGGSKNKEDNSPSNVNLATNLPLEPSVWI